MKYTQFFRKTVCSSLVVTSLLQSISPVFAMMEEEGVPAARRAAAHKQERDPTQYQDFNTAQRNCTAAMKFLLNDLFFGEQEGSCKRLVTDVLLEHMMFLEYNAEAQTIRFNGSSSSWATLRARFTETLLRVTSLRVGSFIDLFTQEGLTAFPRHATIAQKGETLLDRDVRGSVIGVEQSLRNLMNAIPDTEESSYAAFCRFVSLIPRAQDELLRFEERTRAWTFSSILQTAGFFVEELHYSESERRAIQAYVDARHTQDMRIQQDKTFLDSEIEEKQQSFAPLREREETLLRQQQAEAAAREETLLRQQQAEAAVRLEELARVERERQAAEEAAQLREIEKRRLQRLRKQAERKEALSAVMLQVSDVINRIDSRLGTFSVEGAESVMGLGAMVDPSKSPILAQLRDVIGQLFVFNKIPRFTEDLARVKLTPITGADWLMSLVTQGVIDPMPTVKEEFDAHQRRDASFVGQCQAIFVREGMTRSTTGHVYPSFYESHELYRRGTIGIRDLSDRILQAGLAERHRNRLLLPLGLIQTIYQELNKRPNFSSKGKEQLQSLVAKAFIYTAAEAAACSTGAYGREYLMTRDLLEFLAHDNVTGLGAFDA